MDFKAVKTLTHPDIRINGKNGFLKETQTKISCYIYLANEQQIIAGLSTGKLLIWLRKSIDHKYLTLGKEYDTKEYTLPNQHKGEIRCIDYGKIAEMKCYITGSVDRTIKIWDADPKNKQIIQTLAGHGGTILALKYSTQFQTIFSSSNDKTFRIWKLDPGREMMFYPNFFCAQVITNYGIPKKLLDTKGPYISAIEIKHIDKPCVYIGDSEGNLHVLTQQYLKTSYTSADFEIEKSNMNIHRISIIQILNVLKDNMAFTISFDQKIQGYEMINGKRIFSYKNPFKGTFTCLAWDQTNHELFAGDEFGNIFSFNILAEGQTHKINPFNSRVLGMEYLEHLSQMIVILENSIEVIKLFRGVNVRNLVGSHKGPVNTLIEVDPKKIVGPLARDLPKLYSAALDNTIRIWDIAENTASNVIDIDRAELNSMIFLKKSCLFATGHEDGTLRVWNLEIGSYLYLMTKTREKPHYDNICCLATELINERNENDEEESKEYLFSSGYDGKICIWDISDRKTIAKNTLMGSTVSPQLKGFFYPDREQEKHQLGKEILALTFHKKKNIIIAGGNSKKIFIYDKDGEERQALLEGHNDSITSFAMDGYYLFSGSDDKTIKVWNLADYYLLFTINHQDTSVQSLLLLEGTSYLISCSGEEGKVFCWDYMNQSLVNKPYETKGERPRCLAYSEAIKLLFVGTEEHNILSFNISELLGISTSQISSIKLPVVEVFEESKSNTFKLPKIK